MIPFSKPSIGWRERWAVDKVLRSGWLTTGEVTKKFESEFAKYVGANYAVAVSSCTIALELALRYLNVKDKYVIVPSFTFCATAQAVENAGGKVIFGDIEPANLTLDPKSYVVKTGISQAKAIVPVHLGGNKAFTDYDIPVVEDSAHRIEKDQCKGTKNIVCFSFYPTKNMTTGEGGMIATNDQDAYKWFMHARSHGRTKLVGHGYDVLFTGLKANLPDVLSAIGREQLKKLPVLTRERNKIVGWYNELLGDSWYGNHLYPVFRRKRDALIAFMKQNGVQCSAHFSALHKMTAWKKYENWKLPITETLAETEISLPLYPGLKKHEVKKIVELIKQFDDYNDI